MNKKELVAAISEKSGLKKVDVDRALDAFTAVTAEALAAGDKIQLVGFGTFEVAERPARQARNPKNGRASKVSLEYRSFYFRPFENKSTLHNTNSTGRSSPDNPSYSHAVRRQW